MTLMSLMSSISHSVMNSNTKIAIFIRATNASVGAFLSHDFSALDVASLLRME